MHQLRITMHFTSHSLAILNGLDYKTQRWTHTLHIFLHDLLHDRGLASIIEATTRVSISAGRHSTSRTASESSSPCP